jgi:flagellar protein FlaG
MNIDPLAHELTKAAQKAAAGERAPAVDAAKKPEQRPEKPVHAPDAARAVAQQIEAYLRSNNRSLEFTVDTDTGRTIVSVRDKETGELIRQIPGDEVLRIAQAMKELTSLVHETA